MREVWKLFCLNIIYSFIYIYIYIYIYICASLSFQSFWHTKKKIEDNFLSYYLH
jgi:hypothetical protein